MNRRRFLGTSLGALAAILAAGALPGAVYAARGAKVSKAAPVSRLAVVFLRGGLDALSALPPYDDPLYLKARPTLAVPGPGKPGGCVDLGDGLGMHPALAPLEPYWRDGRLAFIESCGFTDAPQDHEGARRLFEEGDPSGKSKSGWMNRLQNALGPVKGAPAISFSPKRPLILKGPLWTRNYLTRGKTALPAGDGLAIYQAAQTLYQDGAMAKTFASARELRTKRLAAFSREMEEASGGACAPGDFPGAVKDLLEQWKRYPGSRLAFLEAGGFDLHYGEREALAGSLSGAARGLADLAQGLGDGLAHTVIAVVSEFGRTAVENAFGGTDNGYGGCMLLLGGPVGGGRVYGQSPELTRLSLRDGRDIPVDVDVREAFSEICANHFRLDEKGLEAVFPGYERQGGLEGLIAREEAAP